MRQIVQLATVAAFALGLAQVAVAAPNETRHELSAQSRPHITIYPRQRALGPNAKRTCRAWLAQEYRVSGPVIVPRQTCWWQ